MGMALQSLTCLVRLLQNDIHLTRCHLVTLRHRYTNITPRVYLQTSTQTFGKDPPRSVPSRRISLRDEQGVDMGVMNRDRAVKMATDSGVRLVLIEQARDGGTPQYQLMSGRRLMAERKRVHDITRALRVKAPKTIRIASRIAPHDFAVKQRQIRDWLSNGHVVTVSIRRTSEKDKQASTELFQKVTEAAKDLATVKQTKTTDTELLLYVKPLPREM